MAFLGFHRHRRGRNAERERSERDWGGERKTLDWGERRYGPGRDISDDYGPERYGAGPDRHGANRYERPQELGQNRGDWRNDRRHSSRSYDEGDYGAYGGYRNRDVGQRDFAGRGHRGYGEREHGPRSWNDRWQESYGPRASWAGGRDERDYRRSNEGDYESREPTHGAYWSPERTSFSDFGRGGGMSSYGGQFRGRGPKGYRRSDERIREDVCECLTEDEHIDASNIDVEVKDCEVTLTGSVSSRDEKRRAEDLIDDLPGVRDIHNNLRVVGGEAGRIEGSQMGSPAGQAGSSLGH